MENYNEKNMKKKYFSCSGAVSRLFSLFILLASLLVLPKAHAAVGGTFTVDQLKYTVLTEEPASQTGTVSVQAVSTGISGDITIPTSVANGGINYSVTLIPDYAFKKCGNMKSVITGNNVTSIGYEAFHSCIALTNIVIPESVTFVDLGALFNCSALTSITIPESVTAINGQTFQRCSSLASVIIPDSVTFIGEWAFSDCTSLTNAVIGNGVTSIGRSAFSNCDKLTNVVIGNSVASISNHAFHGCINIPSLDIPNSVTFIGESTFESCNSLTTVIIPNNVTEIGYYAFYKCIGLKTVTIGNSVTSIGGGAFWGCSNLTSIYFKGNAPFLLGDAFASPTIIYYRAGTTGWTNPWSGRPTALWIAYPVITEQPQSQSVVEGDSVTFSVVATGTEPLYLQWYKEGVAIENATGTSYTIESVSAGDLGNYTVTVTNESGEATSDAATLTLKIPYRATGTVQVVNGFVVGLTVTDGGWGYTREPKFRIKDETGSGATGHCVIENGVVTQIIIDNPGSNYSGEATILIGSPIGNSSLRIGVSEVEVEMSLVLGMEYQLWSSVDCIDWKQVGEPFTAEEEEMTFFFKVADYGRFFKLQEI